MTQPLLVLIPGLDGTGALFQPLLDIMPVAIQTQVVTYSDCDSRQFEIITIFAAPKLQSNGKRQTQRN
ncbi:MAG: hypothetical protein HRT35_26940 [Algicola sp.]|nr:hypothetical protein [Algicola sp.]